jgi:sortase family protein
MRPARARTERPTNRQPFGTRIDRLFDGDRFDIERADGSTVTFAVERLEQHAKSAFPTRAVYGPTDGPTLRLVTCGGAFDRAVGHYRDNIIVYAVAAT